VTFAAMAALVVLIGGVAGAHVALTAKPGTAGAVPLVTSAPPQGATGLARLYEEPLAPEATSQDDAEMARLYEEPWEEPWAAKATPDPVHLASLPAPREIPALVPARRPPLWLRNAVPVTVGLGQPMVAIVIDDLGLNRPAARRAIALPAPLTLSFMTYAENLSHFAADAHAAGHELLLHVPMEPKNHAYDPGPKVLRVGLTREEIAGRLAWGLKRFKGFVGINNHMGSRFTASPEGMGQVMRELRARDLLFLDSVTSAASVAGPAAARAGVPFARRDVFLDHSRRDPGAILGQLEVLERIARQRGYAVGIGHPHTTTLEVLAHWLPEARRRGIALVPISAIVGHRIEVVQSASGRAG
jgi:hypothetical protein